ncbi:hypothetical protein VMCG_02936 [Cytospora schulzeri]|uniref:Uncharacterized protein n=1 Tax=Cytospora schulzeri TaxID=448051 RepID=A0A423WZJ8_9PEZI|nr:hypothetical protein VMCG_02936 [Valsa malicola]
MFFDRVANTGAGTSLSLTAAPDFERCGPTTGRCSLYRLAKLMDPAMCFFTSVTGRTPVTLPPAGNGLSCIPRKQEHGSRLAGSSYSEFLGLHTGPQPQSGTTASVIQRAEDTTSTAQRFESTPAVLTQPISAIASPLQQCNVLRDGVARCRNIFHSAAPIQPDVEPGPERHSICEPKYYRQRGDIPLEMAVGSRIDFKLGMGDSVHGGCG